jgi:hypothetical protein
MPRQRKPVGGSYGAGVPARPDQQMASQAIRQTPGQQPIQTATGGPYGQATQLADAQRAVPLPAAPGIPAPSPGGPSAATPAAGGWQQILDMLAAHPPPAVAPLSGPSMRPGEPSTAGMSSGPGPGPEILAGRGAPVKPSQWFRTLYEQTGDPVFKEQAEKAYGRGQ